MYFNSDTLWQLAIFAAFVGYFYFRRWLNNRPTKSINENTSSSLILALYTLGVELRTMSKGQFENFKYSLMITTLNQSGDSSTALISIPDGTVRAPLGQIIFSLELPYTSGAHFVGFNQNDPNFRTLLGNTVLDNRMRQIKLEGDFPEHFRLYYEANMHIELLEVLDPARMAFLIDFCKRYNWELIANSLYFVQPEAGSKVGQKTMVEAAKQFSEMILPVLRRMS